MTAGKTNVKTTEPHITTITTVNKNGEVIKTKFRVSYHSSILSKERYFDDIVKAREYRDIIEETISAVKLNNTLANLKGDNFYEWPDTLLRAVGVCEEDFENYYDYIVPNFDENFDYATSTLSDRDKDIITLRFKYNQTLEEIGHKYNITKERVRQIESMLIRKLSHPSRKGYFIGVLSPNSPENKFTKEVKEKLTYEAALQVVKEYQAKHTDAKPKITDLPLSVRAVNCLKRAGYIYLEELDELTIDELYKIRNMGSKSAREVVEVLSNYGIQLN